VDAGKKIAEDYVLGVEKQLAKTTANTALPVDPTKPLRVTIESKITQEQIYAFSYAAVLDGKRKPSYFKSNVLLDAELKCRGLSDVDLLALTFQQKKTKIATFAVDGFVTQMSQNIEESDDDLSSGSESSDSEDDHDASAGNSSKKTAREDDEDDAIEDVEQEGDVADFMQVEDFAASESISADIRNGRGGRIRKKTARYNRGGSESE
jgi:hypothetical protein